MERAARKAQGQGQVRHSECSARYRPEPKCRPLVADLIKAALKCVAGPKPSEKTLQDMWTELSSRVYNEAWAGDVKIEDNLSNSTQCIARELCTEMGLRVMGEEE